MQVEMILPTIHAVCILVPCGGVWYYLVVFWSYLVVFGSIWWYFDGIWLCLAMSCLVWVHGDPSISEKFEWPCLYSAHSAKHGSLQRMTLPFRANIGLRLSLVQGSSQVSSPPWRACLYSANPTKQFPLQKVTLPFREQDFFSKHRNIDSSLVLMHRKPFLPEKFRWDSP